MTIRIVARLFIAMMLAMPSGQARAQVSVPTPLPPVRPIDMNMLPKETTPIASKNKAQSGLQTAPFPPQRPASLPARTGDEVPDEEEAETPTLTSPAPVAPTPSSPPPATITPKHEPEAPTSKWGWEWPKMTPDQQDKAETTIVDDTPTGPGITTDPGTSTTCLPPRLKSVLEKIVAHYGSVRVTSTYRPAWRARRGSYHRRCQAVDFRVPGHRPGEVLALVKTFDETGGRKVYWNGLIHVDTGPIRSW